MCYCYKKLSFFDRLGLQRIKIKRKNHSAYVIYKDVELTNRAKKFATYLETFTEENIEHHYIMGDYLGYPKEDVDYFCSGRK